MLTENPLLILHSRAKKTFDLSGVPIVNVLLGLVNNVKLC